ncbi:MAG: TMEM165/GDT1 family protein [Candidatus Bathyarchaeota archaeon]|nr:TMEM165/GDT1 family protein [Candidatus Bathyarchaeota archaeon]
MSVDLAPLLTSFTIIFLAELGDKTQICTIMLSSRSSAHSVFFGAMAAFFIVDGLSALLGGELLYMLPRSIIGLAAGITFIAFGLVSLTRREKEENRGMCKDVGASFFRAFSLVALMELGDKTQIFSIFLASQFGSPMLVLVGVMLAFTTITGIGVFLGHRILRAVPERFLRIGAAVTFILFGLIQIVEALF